MKLFNPPTTQYGSSTPNVGGWAKLIGGVILAIILLTLLLNSFVVVPSGFIGIESTFGRVSGEVQPGFSFKIPLTQKVTLMNTQVQNDSSNESAATNDLQNVSTDVTLNYHLQTQDVDSVYVSLTSAYQANYIEPVVSEATKSITAKFTASELLTQRAQVTSEIQQALVAKLEPKGILVDNLSLTNFTFSPEFTAAVESKNAAQQAAEQAQFNLQKATLDAQANATQDAALSPQILEQQFLSKWNGVLPTTLAGNTSGSGPVVTLPLP
jgi:prohibitin 2